MDSIVRNQLEFARQLEEAKNSQATKQDIMHILATAQLQSQSQVEVIANLATALSKIEQRVQAWETWFLPEVMDRLPHGIPASSPSTPTPLPTLPATSPQPAASSQPSQNETQQAVTADTPEATIIGLLRQRSEASRSREDENTGRVRNAMRPFGAQ